MLVQDPGLAMSLGLWYQGTIHFVGTDTPGCLFFLFTVDFIAVTFFFLIRFVRWFNNYLLGFLGGSVR